MVRSWLFKKAEPTGGSLTKDDVHWCYQNLLKRAPDSEAMVEGWIRNAVDWRVLVKEFTSSLEYWHKFTTQPLKTGNAANVSAQANILATLRLLRPHDVEGHRKIRVGREGDSGYVMIDDFVGLDAIYSLGISTDVSWDLAMAQYGKPVFQYDHTVDALPMEHELFRWRKVGIGDNAAELLSPLHLLMQENGHAGDADLLLKCDIEGAEWEMLSTMPDDCLKRFRQIVIEVHGLEGLARQNGVSAIAQGISALTRFHRVVHAHGNNSTPFCVVAGIPLPETLELTLVRTDAYSLKPSNETFPTALDRRCHPERAELMLGSFTF